MFYGFQTALSALNATSTAIDVTANNLANLNTTGFKQSQVSFQDLFAQSLGSLNSAQPGFGVASPQIRRQGSFDAAIQGDGFFVLRDPSTNAQLLSRAGSFTTDKSGNLISSSGANVQGWTQLNSDGTVNTNGPIGSIQLPTGALRQPVATQNFALNMNLDASAAVGSATATFSQPIQVVDSLGNTQTLSATFTKTASNSWSYAITIPASALTSPPTAPLAQGTLTFDTAGKLLTPAATPPATANQIPVPVTGLADGAADLALNWNLNDVSGNPVLTQVVEPSAVSSGTQDGIEAAQLTKVGIGTGGAIIAQYSNGQQHKLDNWRSQPFATPSRSQPSATTTTNRVRLPRLQSLVLQEPAVVGRFSAVHWNPQP